ncbi:DNA repair protein RadC [Geobacillus thermoleovorans CCB_US3_UF5]|uniref:DNA repair protein RadC n=1 Tax=Geobacillus thermoleovorans CCB_US3_UF5 TaxID=1111068 RepID=A0ABM5MDV2_GEOTH|nr:DNA repair protein RadC [Geobacillus thermoleovorans CCB_US3_UF5]GAJ60404.1 hypothetical protein B23_3649 [Geobacillus thermoleovorans B23]
MEIGWLIFYVIEPLKSGSILDYQIHGYLPNHFDSIWAIYTTFILVSFYMYKK